MVKLLLVICVFSVWAVAEISCATPHNAPAPSVDCSTLILNMADCLTFVSDGSKVTKPEGGCCNGLKMVLKADAQCPCEAFKSSAQMGVVLNVTKAMTLPSACGVNAPSMSTCGLSGVPGAAPAHPPKSSAPSPKVSKSRLPTSTSVAPAAAPTGGSSSATAPALSPAQSDAISVSMSFVLAIVSVVAASCSFF